MRRESRKGRSAVSGRQKERESEREKERETRRGCAYDGHVGETQRDIRRAHSWASRRDVKSYLSLGPRFYTARRGAAQRRAAMHDARHAARCTRCRPRYRRPRFLFDLHWRVGPGPEKRLAPATVRSKRSPTTTAGSIVAQPRASLQAKIYIQFIFRMKGDSINPMIHEAIVITYLG